MSSWGLSIYRYRSAALTSIFILALGRLFYLSASSVLSTGSYQQSLQDQDDSESRFQLPGLIRSESTDQINIGMVVINNRNISTLEPAFQWKLKRTLRSILTHSSGDPLHMIIITDKHSINVVHFCISNLISKYVSEGVITRRSWRWRRMRGIPRIQISFADCEEIVSLEKDFFGSMKRNSQQGDSRGGSYTEDLFYIAPVYHRAFTHLDRIIFLDSKDLQFTSDISLLQQQFSLMGSALIGIGPDLTPHYHSVLTTFVAKHPNSSLGLPGKMQGFNTGVVLYRLDKMRESALYNQYVTPEGVDQLMEKYMFKMTVGDQDWMTNLGFSHPDIFYHLPCQFNRQTSIDYLRPPWVDIFPAYHHCDLPSNIRVWHRNGCGPTPRTCGHQYPSRGSQIHDISVDVEQLWVSLAEIKERPKTKLKKFSLLLRDILLPRCVPSAHNFCMQVFDELVAIDE